jgi:hypothetical protein
MGIKLKIWNGRGHGKYQNGSIFVAAFTQKHAAELVSMACFGVDNRVSLNEIRNYFHSGTWGNSMEGIEPTEPCVYATNEPYGREKPVRVI